MGNESQEKVEVAEAVPNWPQVTFNPIKTNVILTAGMAAGMLCTAYIFTPVEAANSLKDVLILVSGGLLALAGTMAIDPAPDAFRSYLDYRLTKFRAKMKREPRVNN